MNMKFKLISLCMMFLLCITSVYAYERSELKEGIENFPSSYRKELQKLKDSHPNWNFVAVYTNLDWNYTMQQEMREGISLIRISDYSKKWQRDSTEVEIGWVNASEYAVEYFLDPRNSLTEEKIFQFELLTFNEAASNVNAIEEILSGTGMYNKNYYINDKNVINMNFKYSDLIYESGKNNNLNPLHLASRIVQETGGTIASLDKNNNVIIDSNGNLRYVIGNYSSVANRSLNGSYISDTYGNFIGYYNFFNIGAYCTQGCNYCGNAFVHGLEKAKSENWNTPKLAINAAGAFLQNNYIKWGQNTVYFEKFDVNFSENAVSLFGSQYMANVAAASQEASLMYKGYSSANMLDNNFTFYIPVYDNMPSKSIATLEKVPPFVDLSTDAWYYDAARYCYNNNIINGTSKDKFSPNNKVTRGMLVTMLYGMEGAPKVSGTCKFTDVSSLKYYYNAILWATKNKIVNGYAGMNKFGPDDYITREQLATILANFAMYKGKYTASNYGLNKFIDASSLSSYALPAVRWACKNGIVNGSNGKLNPKGTATRAEAATMIYSYCLKFK